MVKGPAGHSQVWLWQPKPSQELLLYLAFRVGFSPAQGDQVPLQINETFTLLMTEIPSEIPSPGL